MSEVLPRLWIGSCWDANSKFVVAHQISRVLTVANDCPSPTVKKNTNWMHVNIEDDRSVNILQEFENTNKFIDGGGGVLVHCEGGVSRSPSIVAAYMMWKFGYSPMEALSIIGKHRYIEPNVGFRTQLDRYYRRLHDIATPSPKPTKGILLPLAQTDNIILKLPPAKFPSKNLKQK